MSDAAKTEVDPWAVAGDLARAGADLAGGLEHGQSVTAAGVHDDLTRVDRAG